jgi:hypothetical protein
MEFAARTGHGAPVFTVGVSRRCPALSKNQIEEHVVFIIAVLRRGVLPIRPESREGEILMDQLFETLRGLVSSEMYIVGQHAAERMEQRGILEWQAVAGLEDGELIVERPDADPNPAVEVREALPDGTEFKAVWSHLQSSGVAKLVTVHFFDEE